MIYHVRTDMRQSLGIHTACVRGCTNGTNGKIISGAIGRTPNVAVIVAFVFIYDMAALGSLQVKPIKGGYVMIMFHISPLKYELHHEESCLRGLRPGKTQTGLLCYID